MIHVYTDGACKVNPGKGGWGAVIVREEGITELFGGCYEVTTNNRMEILAVIKGLENLAKHEATEKIVVYSDSQYVVNSMSKGWAVGWKAKGWIKSDKKKAKNIDLWIRLLDLSERYALKFQWVRGHDGNTYNERCDALCNQGIEQLALIKDEGYEDDTQPAEQMLLF